MPHSWAATANNQVPSYFTVKDAVAGGNLAWKSGDPGAGAFPTPPSGAHAEGYCFTRADFEDHVQHSDMSSSGIALNQLMSKSQMETYRLLNHIISSVADSEHTIPPDWRGRLISIAVGPGTNSIRVERSINLGAFAHLETFDVTPGGTGYVTSYTNLSTGDTLDIRLIPFTGSSGGGTAGPNHDKRVNEP